MKIILRCLVIVFFVPSFGQYKSQIPNVDPEIIQSSFTNWLNYNNEHILLSSNFIPLDYDSTKITKEDFLKKLIKGNAIPIQLQSNDSFVYYQLFELKKTSNSSINATITQNAFEEYEHFKMEGKVFPQFRFTDLKGESISNENLKGKTIVIKCWYIHCTACIKEFPKVNQLVQKYKNQKDLYFLSLAEDSPEALRAFLAKKSLCYTVVANKKNI